MTRIYLSLGSNLGDRAANIARAIEELAQYGVHITRQSSLYETEPADVPADLKHQPWFLNSVVEAETELAPAQLMRALLEIERSLGPERRVSKGPRLIDLDILLFGSQAVRTAEVEIPHPRLALRRFVLVPLAEIAPEVRHPVLKKTAAEMLELANNAGEVHKFVF